LSLHAGVTDVHFGSNAGIAELACHLLVVAGACLIHQKHHDRRLRGSAALQLAEMSERRVKAGDANREPCRGHGLRSKAPDEAVIPSAAAHRSEPHRLSTLVRGWEGQICLDDWAGVIFEPTDDRCIEANAVLAVARLPDEFNDRSDGCVCWDCFSGKNRQDGIRLLRSQFCTRRIVSAFILAAFAQQLRHT
jgi:hypothetical protein